MSKLKHVIIPGKSVMLANLHPKKMFKRMLRSFMVDKNIYRNALSNHFENTHLATMFSVEDIYDNQPKENNERLMLHLVADVDISNIDFINYVDEAMIALQSMANEITAELPGEFNNTTYENLIAITAH